MMGDWNSVVGQGRKENIVGDNGLGELNEGGEN